MPDDHSNTIAGATEISLGTDFSGTLDYTLDADIFSIDLIAGQTYSFDFQLPDGVRSWLHLDLLDAGGNSIVPYEDVLDTSMTFRATTSGTHYVAVRHYEDGDEERSFLGSYTGQVQVIEDDYPTVATPSDDVINPGETVTGAINHNLDRDAVRVNVEFDLEALISGQSSHSVNRDFENDVDTIRVYTTSSVGNDISDYAQQVGDDLLLEVNSQVSLMIWDMTLAALQGDVVFELV